MGNQIVKQSHLLFPLVSPSVSFDLGRVCSFPRPGRERSGSSYTRAQKHSHANPSSASPGWTDLTDPPLHLQKQLHSICRCHMWSWVHYQWLQSRDVRSQRRILRDFQEKVDAWPSGGCSWRYPRCLWTHWSHTHCSRDTEAQSRLLASHRNLV